MVANKIVRLWGQMRLSSLCATVDGPIPTESLEKETSARFTFIQSASFIQSVSFTQSVDVAFTEEDLRRSHCHDAGLSRPKTQKDQRGQRHPSRSGNFCYVFSGRRNGRREGRRKGRRKGGSEEKTIEGPKITHVINTADTPCLDPPSPEPQKMSRKMHVFVYGPNSGNKMSLGPEFGHAPYMHMCIEICFLFVFCSPHIR